jgi:hypothetical protein
MKPLIQNTFFSIALITSFLAFEASAETNSSSDDIWITFCLNNFDPGKDIDECLNMGGIWQSRQNRIKGFKILPRKVSEALELTLAPTSKPTPLIFGHYWRCINPKNSEFESCEPVLVVCTDDQSMCAETP